MKLTDWGHIGRLEAARQALDEAGGSGLTARQIMNAAGLSAKAGGGSTQHFLLQLTTYCYIYEADSGRRFYLDQTRDEDFDRHIFADEDLLDTDPEEEIPDE